MTFDEWWIDYEKLNHFGCGEVASDFARDAWDAAVATEREACAKVCDHEKDGGRNDGDQAWAECGEFCANVIRMRSNKI